jgi:hypothetical protein
MTISGHFSAKYINIFHKTGVQTNILGCLTCLNLNWIKSYDIKHIFYSFLRVFNFERKKNENLLLINGHCTTTSGHFSACCIKIFHKTEVQTVILRCLVCLNLNWIKSYNIILVKNSFFSCLKMHHFRAILPKWVLTPFRKPALIFS